MRTRALAAALVAATSVLVVSGCGTPGAPSSGPTPSGTPTLTPSPTPTTSSPSPSPTPTTTTATPTPSASPLPAWLADGVVTRLPTSRHVIALTFDGGAGAQGAPKVLAALAAAHVPATFFLTGDFARANPTTVASIAAGGYVIGDHSMTHRHFPQLSTAAATREVKAGAAALTAITGHSPKPWFRFPYGEYDARTLDLVHDLGYGAFGWSIDTRGWEGRSAGTAADIVARVRSGLRPGAIVLMHLGANPDDGTTFDADALAAVIAAVRAAGYGFVDVSG